MTTKSEIQSLLFLLEDPDPFVKEQVTQRFYSLGEHAVPLIDECRLETKETTSRQLADNMLFELTFSGLYADFYELYELGITDFTQLERALFLLTRFGNPTLRTSVYRQQLDIMAKQIMHDITYAIDKVEQMNILLHYVFETEGFHGTKDDLFKAESSYMHKVLETKKGIPLSISMIVLALAHRLELPFYGVNMPMHFILMFENDAEIIYIDPFQGGKFLSRKELDTFLVMNNVDPNPTYYKKASSAMMLIRTMRNLHYSFQQHQDSLRATKLKMLIDLHEQFYPEM
jgi:regulator of sirC expression with transglutaminase-like and TPR domain